MNDTPDTTPEKRSITIEDLNRIQYVNDPQISPDGQWIACVLQSANPMENGYTRNIYLIATDGGEPIQVTRSGKDSTPRWSPDSTRLAFVSARGDTPQIYLLPVTAPGGEPRPLTRMENGAMAPAWSPDGSQMAFLSNLNADERASEDSDDDDSDTPPKDQLEAKHRKERKQEDEKNRFDPRPMERIPYRQGTSYMDDRYPQVYVIATDDNPDDDDAATPRRLTHLDTFYSPPEWSADGKTIYTTRAYDIEADEYFRYRNLYALDVESGEETRLIADPEHIYFGVKASPDGKWLAALRTPSHTTDAMIRFCLMPVDTSSVTDLNENLDRPVYDFDWTADSTLIAQVARDGRFEIYQVDPASPTFEPLVTDEQSLYGMSISPAGSLAYVSRTTTRLDELFYMADLTASAQQMTTFNSDFLDEITVQPTHTIHFDNGDGQQIQGWYILPPDFDESKQYPLALHIHGGPHVMWVPSARSLWHEWQSHAAEGYVVFYCNPRGSDGYGEAFEQALHSNWGHVAMQDIMAGVDTMLEKGFIDESRMAITGGSYGGYMTGWIIGHTQRFAAAVPQRGVYNLTSFYGTSDVPVLISAEFDTEPWNNYEKLWEHSPLAYAQHITTPTLIIHAENDFRVPIEQAEQFFAWIRRATDTPVKMLRYPREGHELSRSGEPKHRVSRLTEMMNWFNTYCKPDADDSDSAVSATG